MAHEVETMFSAREVPWHGLGTVTADALTAEEAIDAAGLNWEVELRPNFTLNAKGDKINSPGVFSVVRTSDDRVLGTVRARYKPFQNRDAFSFMNSLVDNGEAIFETAGSLRFGRQVFITMKVGKTILVAGEDAHDMYIFLRTSHDGTRAVSAYVTMVRVVCMNTATLASNTAAYKWSMRHVTTMDGKIQEARDALSLTFDYRDAFEAEVAKLMATKITDKRAVTLLTKVLPNRPKTADKIDGIMECYKTSDCNGYVGTGWGLVNGFTEYHEHWRNGLEREATLHNVLDGEIAKWRNRLADALVR